MVTLGRVAGQHREADAQRFAGLFQVFSLQAVEVHPEHLHALPLPLLGSSVEFGNFYAARAAPFRPVVEHQPVPFNLLGFHCLAVLVQTVICTASAEQQARGDGQCCCQTPCHGSILLEDSSKMRSRCG
ncbi:hypothetical protein D3C85_1407310 [compost metagenome]